MATTTRIATTTQSGTHPERYVDAEYTYPAHISRVEHDGLLTGVTVVESIAPWGQWVEVVNAEGIVVAEGPSLRSLRDKLDFDVTVEEFAAHETQMTEQTTTRENEMRINPKGEPASERFVAPDATRYDDDFGEVVVSIPDAEPTKPQSVWTPQTEGLPEMLEGMSIKQIKLSAGNHGRGDAKHGLDAKPVYTNRYYVAAYHKAYERQKARMQGEACEGLGEALHKGL